jgi:hypothetical protein
MRFLPASPDPTARLAAPFGAGSAAGGEFRRGAASRPIDAAAAHSDLWCTAPGEHTYRELAA